jgi:hypothetical protein
MRNSAKGKKGNFSIERSGTDAIDYECIKEIIVYATKEELRLKYT